MIGLLFLTALVLCIWVSVWIANKLGNLISNPEWRSAVKIVIFIALLASPFVDELIGKNQFEALCKANGIESVDVSKARGKRVIAIHSERMLIDGTVMPIKVSHDIFRAADSGEVLIQSKDYYAMGGWLMRYTPVSLGSPQPMLFDGNGCGLIAKDRIFSNNQILQIN